MISSVSQSLLLLLLTAIALAAPMPAPSTRAARTDCPLYAQLPQLETPLQRCRPWTGIEWEKYPALSASEPRGYWMCITDLPDGLNNFQRTAWKPTIDAEEHLDWEAKQECPPLEEFLGIVDETGLHA